MVDVYKRQSKKNPVISMGINLGFEWKGFDVAADFAGGFKNTFVADWDLKWGVTRSVDGCLLYTSIRTMYATALRP